MKKKLKGQLPIGPKATKAPAKAEELPLRRRIEGRLRHVLGMKPHGAKKMVETDFAKKELEGNKVVRDAIIENFEHYFSERSDKDTVFSQSKPFFVGKGLIKSKLEKSYQHLQNLLEEKNKEPLGWLISDAINSLENGKTNNSENGKEFYDRTREVILSAKLGGKIDNDTCVAIMDVLNKLEPRWFR